VGLSEIIIIAIGLSMDAFAVSITLGLSVKKPKIFEYFIPGIYFGLFQAIMPLTGYFAGSFFADKIHNFEHWIAFVLLGFIGGKMIRDSFSEDEEKEEKNAKKPKAAFSETEIVKKVQNPFGFIKMLILAVATSIDALTVGVTFAFFQINIFMAITIIGFTTFAISVCGVKIGNIFGEKFKTKAEFLGGAILVILGTKILIEHLFPGK